MVSFITQMITPEKHPALLRLWRTFRPERIVVRDFIPGGCMFDAVTPMESYRVTSLGLEQEFVAMLLSDITPGTVFYDIGSCIGMYTLHAAHLGATVYAFEPDPGFRKRLIHNIRINKLSRRVNIIDWAVTNSPGSVVLFTDGIDGNSPSLVHTAERGMVKVRTNTIDAGIAGGELIAPDIVKIDIEGAEKLALLGMQQLLASRNAPSSIYLELHPAMLQQIGASVDECLALIETFGYEQIYSSSRSGQVHLIYRKVSLD